MLTAGRAAGANDSRSSSDRQRIESSPRAARSAAIGHETFSPSAAHGTVHGGGLRPADALAMGGQRTPPRPDVVFAGDNDNKMYAINKDIGAQERGCLADAGFAKRRSDFLDNGFVFENMEGQVCVPAGA